jgi:chorismate mutase
LIERVQFPLNKTVYVPGGVKIPNSELSLLDYLLREQERIQSRVRRYQSPDEYPFFPDVLEEYRSLITSLTQTSFSCKMRGYSW